MTTEMFVGILSLITSVLSVGITIGISIANKKNDRQYRPSFSEHSLLNFQGSNRYQVLPFYIFIIPQFPEDRQKIKMTANPARFMQVILTFFSGNNRYEVLPFYVFIIPRNTKQSNNQRRNLLSHFINGHTIGDKARLLSRFSIDYINMLFTRFYIKPSINQIPVNFKNRLLVKQCIKLFISHISVSFLTKYSRKHISRNKPSRKVNSYCVIRIKSL